MCFIIISKMSKVKNYKNKQFLISAIGDEVGGIKSADYNGNAPDRAGPA